MNTMSYKRTDRTVLFVVILISAVSAFLVFKAGFTMTYNDAASHLNIARRVVDNLTPGIAQIGTVWLPLPHILMLPFAWIDFLWHTGFAGSIVSMTSFVVAVYAVYKTLRLLTKSTLGALLGASVMLVNPNILYLQSTPMTESLMLATISMTLYFFVRYLQSHDIRHLVLTGVAVALATLTRYDGWFLFLCLLIILPLHTWITKGRKSAEGVLFLFASVGGFGILLWLLWNLAIFHDPFYFIRGPFSAASQQKVLHAAGQLPTQGNVILSGIYYLWSILDTNGLVVSLFSVLGLAILLFSRKNRASFFVGVVLLSPLVFNILSLYAGQSGMNVPQAPLHPGYFNIRYGLMALPSIAIGIGILAMKKAWQYVLIPAIAVQTLMFFLGGYPATLVDGLAGLKNTYYTVEASAWLAHHYTDGLILTSLASHDAFVARAGLPMRLYVHEGTRAYWTNALKQPSSSVVFIATLAYPPDVVYAAMVNNPDFKKHFALVHRYDTFEIYQRK
jgi:4-amino-4-deoxy-L-arabinose transferase-like glycosyltransferase